MNQQRLIARSTVVSLVAHAALLLTLCLVPTSIVIRFATKGPPRVNSGYLSVIRLEVPVAQEVATEFLTTVSEAFDEIDRASSPSPNLHDLERTDFYVAETTISSAIDSSDQAIQPISAIPYRRTPSPDQLPEVSDLAVRRPRNSPTVVSLVASPAGSIHPSVGVSETEAADLSQNAPPKYPVEAIARRMEGVVLLKLRIDATGRVIRVDVVESSGHASLDHAATEAVRTWQGQPAKRFGRPVASEEVLPIRFRF